MGTDTGNHSSEGAIRRSGVMVEVLTAGTCKYISWVNIAIFYIGASIYIFIVKLNFHKASPNSLVNVGKSPQSIIQITSEV